MSSVLASPIKRGNLRHIDVLGDIHLPATFADFSTFREWTRSGDYPQNGDVFWLGDTLWVDAHVDKIDSHNAVKTEFVRVLGNLCKAKRLGYVYSDRARLTHPEVELSNEPDALFIAIESLRAEKVRRIAGADGEIVELEGSADMVLEVVSRRSETKDNRSLRDLYFRAGILEYWLVDARRKPLHFDILRRGPRGFVPTRKQDGWLRSEVFDGSFVLNSEVDELGVPEFTLGVRI